VEGSACSRSARCAASAFSLEPYSRPRFSGGNADGRAEIPGHGDHRDSSPPAADLRRAVRITCRTRPTSTPCSTIPPFCLPRRRRLVEVWRPHRADSEPTPSARDLAPRRAAMRLALRVSQSRRAQAAAQSRRGTKPRGRTPAMMPRASIDYDWFRTTSPSTWASWRVHASWRATTRAPAEKSSACARRIVISPVPGQPLRGRDLLALVRHRQIARRSSACAPGIRRSPCR